MRKLIIGTAATLSLFGGITTAAEASAPTPHHVATYTRLYHTVATRFGTRTPGRNILRWGYGRNHAKATDGQVRASIVVFHRMLTPPPVVHVVYHAPVAPVASTVPQATPTQAPPVTNTAYTVSAAPATGLAGCIVSRESGGNPQAVNPNGHYGIAQWSPSTWVAQGGGKYSSTPLGASKAQQMAVLNGALANGQSGAWTPYDGC